MSILLLVSGIFNFVVWPTFMKRVARDPRARDDAGKPTRFLIVHVVIVTVALALGAASIVTAVLSISGVW